MAVQAYIPTDVRFADRPIEGTRLITIYDADQAHRNGSMTTSHPLGEGTRGGPLIFVGRRDGKEWRVQLAEIAVRSRSAMGFEYDILGEVETTILREGLPDNRRAIEKSLGDYGATF